MNAQELLTLLLDLQDLGTDLSTITVVSRSSRYDGNGYEELESYPSNATVSYSDNEIVLS